MSIATATDGETPVTEEASPSLEQVAGPAAADEFSPAQQAAIDQIPPADRVEFEVIDCSTVDLKDQPADGGDGPTICITSAPSDEVKEIAPNATASDMFGWGGENIQPDELLQAECAVLEKAGAETGGYCDAPA